MAEYSDRIVEHFTNPRNVGELDPCHVKAFVGNPVCGDQIHLYARVEQDRIVECSFLAYGCAASLATASILTEEIKGRPINELTTIEEARIVEMVGGLTATQRHCATIGRDVLRALAKTYLTGEAPNPSNPNACT